MRWQVAVLGAGAVAGTWGAHPQSSGANSVAMQAVRFYRADRTLVNGFVRVPHGMLGGVTLGPGGIAAYRITVSIVDSGGTVLKQDGWNREIPWSTTRVTGAATVEPLAFALAPGSYDLRVVVRDSATGHEQTAHVALAAYGARPQASDLLLAYGIRLAAPGDTATGANEVAKGDLRITSGPELVLTPSQAMLFYYCEVYADSAATVPWTLQVSDSGGRVLVRTPAAQTTFGAGGGSITGSVDLAGLPPGAYELTLHVGAEATGFARAAGFRMGGLDLDRQVAAATGAAADPTDAFAQMTEGQMDTVFAPLLYLAHGNELSVYRPLTVEGKRRFLREFWRRRDPTPTTPENEAQIGFYQRIADANRRFGEHGAAQIPGWRTDRGRIFVLYGEPQDVLHHPMAGGSRPFEVWKYTRDRAFKYVFLDQTRLGNYVLIFSDDRRERSYPDWEFILGPDAVQEVQRF